MKKLSVVVFTLVWMKKLSVVVFTLVWMKKLSVVVFTLGWMKKLSVVVFTLVWIIRGFYLIKHGNTHHSDTYTHYIILASR